MKAENRDLMKYLSEHYAADTTAAYHREIMIFLGNFPQARKAVYKDLVGYLGALRTRYNNPRTLNRILAAIKAYYSFLNYSEKRKDNPAKTIRLRDKPSRDIQLQDLFTPQELQSLMDRKERTSRLHYRNKVLMSLLVYQGLRPKEMEVLSLNDINLQKGSIYIKPTHTTNSRELALKPEQIMLFHQYIFEIRPKLLRGKESELLLIGGLGNPMPAEDIIKHVIRTGRNRFEGRKVNAHKIRQSVLANLLADGNDLRIVQVFAGHKYPSSTEAYRQTNVEALRMALNQYHPVK